jgi:hypothetical protein
MNEVSITFDSVAENYAIDSITDILTLYMNRCSFVYPATSTEAYVIKSLTGQLRRTWIDDCFFNLGDTSSAGALIATLLCQNVFVMNSHIAYLALSATNLGITTTTLTQCQIKGCYFANVNSGIVATTSLGNIIADCGFSVEDSAIDLSGADGVVIENNIVLKTTTATATTNLIRILDSENVLIQENILVATSIVIPAGAMIYVARTASDVSKIFIKDNVLLNSGNNIGIATGIHVASNTVAGAVRIQIMGNSIHNFYGAATSNSILMTQTAESIVSNNTITSARHALYMTDCFLSTITNNYFLGTENVNVVFMEITAALAPGDGRSIFSNNYVGNDNNVVIGQDLVYIKDSSIYHYIINGNIFEIPFIANIAGALLALEGASHVVTNNIFFGNTFTTKAPFVAGPNGLVNSYVANNMFNLITAVPAGTMIDFGAGTGNTDFMNKGQIYSVVLPVSRAVWDTGSGWEHSFVAIPYKAQLHNTGTVNGQAGIEFSSIDIPVGATITNVSMYIYVADTSDLTVYLRRSAWNEIGDTGQTLAGPFSPLVATVYTTLTFAVAANNIIDANETYCVYFTTDNPTAAVWIESVLITYTL